MLTILDYIRKLLLGAAKRYSPARFLQYLLALCRVVFKKCNFKYGDENSSHRFPLPKTPTIADGCLSEESIGTPAGHAISGSYPPAQPQGPMNAVGAHNAQNNDTFPSPYRCKPPLKQGLQCLQTRWLGLINMVLFLDHPGFIQRSLADTQGKDSMGIYTDIEKWRKFSHTYAEDTNSVSLLGTVLIAANVGFLAIQTVDKPDGVFSLPQRFSYLSLLFAQASVVMGLAIRSPRLFID
ncbi:hypothetical protein SCLCIDRAFT_248929 [Scleroderma citrinum Foug A]|uniref:Uncharacterized protein n=1 Tax=Scleroderma citrinum Foug A TaxID=1036808 RepID=A0A0C3DIT9_9AGAM|nr:hypothetical protein SCLCIDRAFT_248929 [Scleroderma citrinum Foug A]